MWLLGPLGCLAPEPVPLPAPEPVADATLPVTTLPEPLPEAVLGWVGEAVVVPGVSWTGTEQQIALADDGTRLCEYTWQASAVIPDPTPATCADADGVACEWQMTVALTGGLQTGEPCAPFFVVPAAPDAGPYAYGYTSDWSDGTTGRGPRLLSFVDPQWIPVDPAVSWDPATGSLAYFILAQ